MGGGGGGEVFEGDMFRIIYLRGGGGGGCIPHYIFEGGCIPHYTP